MSQAFIVCPDTEKQVYIGLNLEWGQVEAFQIGNQETTCPHCGKKHVWNKYDLILRSDGGGD
jgi:hypothetical protein